MPKDTSNGEATRRAGLLKDQVQLVKRKNCDRYEIISIPDNLSFEKGFFVVIRACQLLVQKNEGLIILGVAGPSGAGKTVFTEKILSFMPSVAVISMDNYNDASRIVDGNFDGKNEYLISYFIECVQKDVNKRGLHLHSILWLKISSPHQFQGQGGSYVFEAPNC